MKLKTIKIGFLLTVVTLMNYTVSNAQNTNVVSAALEFEDYLPSLMKQDIDQAKKHLLEAKSLIEKAMKHESTADDPKANYYNAVINYSLLELAGMDTTDAKLAVYLEKSDSIIEVIQASGEKARKKGRYGSKLEDYFKRKVGQSLNVGAMMFEQKKFDYAFAGFASGYQIKKIAGLDKDLDAVKNNAIISARHFIQQLVDTGKVDKAMEFTSEALEIFPKSEDLAIDGINIAIQQNNIPKAEEFYAVAEEASPENKQLFSTMGSIYLSAANKKQKQLSDLQSTDSKYAAIEKEANNLYEKAEKSLLKALSVDSLYADANYNLGVMYLGIGKNLETKARRMPLNNPNYKKVMDQSKAMYKKSVVALERYIVKDPNNASVLSVLYQVHRNLGNSEKALEYKKRADAAK